MPSANAKSGRIEIKFLDSDNEPLAMPFDPRSPSFPLFAAITSFLRERAEKAGSCRECLEKGRRYDILKCATPLQFRQMWDRMLDGEKFDALVDELGKVQEELAAVEAAEE